MRTLRRYFLIGSYLGWIALAANAITAASAQEDPTKYPTRPIHIIVGFTPGGGNDIIARIVGQKLSESLGQPVVIDNKPGAGAIVATEYVAKSDPDGYTLLVGASGAMAVNPAVFAKLPYDPIRDFTPVSELASFPLILIVNAASPIKSVSDLIAYAKANPDKINMSSPGIGSANHVLGELFQMMTGVKLVHIPYKGSQFPDLLSGQVQITFNPLPSSLNFINTGKLRALAVTSATRQAVLPDVPTVGEFVPGYEGNAWFGIGAPKNTSKEIVDKLNSEINAGLADPKLSARLIDLGGVPMLVTPAEFGKFIADETEKWGKVVKFAGLKVK